MIKFNHDYFPVLSPSHWFEKQFLPILVNGNFICLSLLKFNMSTNLSFLRLP